MGILYDVYIKHKNIDEYTKKSLPSETVSKDKKKCSSDESEKREKKTK